MFQDSWGDKELTGIVSMDGNIMRKKYKVKLSLKFGFIYNQYYLLLSLETRRFYPRRLC